MVRMPLTRLDAERGRCLGAVLRRARGARSILDVALDAGVSPETLRKIETGRVATPAFSTIAVIADSLGLSLDEVWSEVASVAAAREAVAAPVVAAPTASARVRRDTLSGEHRRVAGIRRRA
jgi:transcriptional regulator with XRE-family HTH domain